MDERLDGAPPPGGARTTALLLAVIFLVLLAAIVWLFTGAGLFTHGGVPPVP